MRPDQAHGLRRLFAAPRARLLPVVSNPHVVHGSTLLEALCAALADLDQKVLLVDAGELAPAACSLAAVDLRPCIERLSGQVSYLAARGLPMRHLDARGSAAGFVDVLAEASPGTDLVLLHASAPELARVLGDRPTRPLLLADSDPESVMHAYSGMKWLTHRAQIVVYSVLMSCSPQSRLAVRIAQQLASCADTYLGAAVRDWACLDPRWPQSEQLTPELRHLAHELVLAAGAELPAVPDGLPVRAAALPRGVRLTPALASGVH